MASNSMEGITGASLLLWFLSQLFIWFYYFQQYYNWKVIWSTICRPYFQTLSARSSLIRVVHWFWRPIDSALCSSSWWPLPFHQTQTSPFWVQAGRVELVPLTSRMAYFISVSRRARLSPDFSSREILSWCLKFMQLLHALSCTLSAYGTQECIKPRSHFIYHGASCLPWNTIQ